MMKNRFTAAVLALLLTASCTACSAVTPGPSTTRSTAAAVTVTEAAADDITEETEDTAAEETEVTAAAEETEVTETEDTARAAAAEEPEDDDGEDISDQPEVPEIGEGIGTVYAVSAVNVRDAPNKNSNVIGTLYAGQSVTKLGDDNSWVEINFNGQVGYVYEEYISDTQP